jgi:aminoglycoside 6'-N-acetyltransferase I
MTIVPRAASTTHPEPGGLCVREATPRDLDAIVSLRLALLHEYPDHPVYGRLRGDISDRARELFATQLRSPMEVIFLAERDAQAIGVLRCVESLGSPLLEPARYAYVSSVFVRADSRRRGVLRAMLRAADRWAQARGLRQMRLHKAAGSDSAEGAWSALGFGVVEQVRLRDLNQQRD